MTSTTKAAAVLFALFACGACAEDAEPVTLAPLPTVAPARSAPTEPAALAAAAPEAPKTILDTHVESTHEGVDEGERAAHERPNDGADPLPNAVRVDRFVLTSGIEAREPVDALDVFSESEDGIYAFLQLSNEGGLPTEVQVHFEKADDPALPYGIALDVPSAPRWRTWAVTRIPREPGLYRAVVRTTDGVDLATRSFEIVAD